MDLNSKIQKYRFLREASYFLKSSKYVLNNLNLQFRDKYIEEHIRLLDFILESSVEDFEKNEKIEEKIKIFKINRTSVYYSTYVYEDYRYYLPTNSSFGFALLLFIPVVMPLLKLLQSVRKISIKN